jgi:hypothetical protein
VVVVDDFRGVDEDEDNRITLEITVSSDRSGPPVRPSLMMKDIHQGGGAHDIECHDNTTIGGKREEAMTGANTPSARGQDPPPHSRH